VILVERLKHTDAQNLVPFHIQDQFAGGPARIVFKMVFTNVDGARPSEKAKVHDRGPCIPVVVLTGSKANINDRRANVCRIVRRPTLAAKQFVVDIDKLLV
jgi:hypothetical protein